MKLPIVLSGDTPHSTRSHCACSGAGQVQTTAKCLFFNNAKMVTIMILPPISPLLLLSAGIGFEFESRCMH